MTNDSPRETRMMLRQRRNGTNRFLKRGANFGRNAFLGRISPGAEMVH
jgi:hypothetical protein